ncbi:MAG: D-erythronate dehydrogenase [Hyphomicrobiales bacterium]
MHVLIVGAAGMIGRKLTGRMVADGGIGGREVTALTLCDVVEPEAPAGFRGRIATRAADLSAPGTATALVEGRPDLIFHLAAIVSGEAETDFEKGYRINLDGTRLLFEAIRKEGLKSPYRPRVVYTSSIAAFGAPFPDRIGDDFIPAPLTSYGTQKVAGELLLADYSRRGLFDGIGIRLPTICVRPGKPNKAASGFFSGILREPLAGQEAVLPVSEDVRHWFASPRSAIGQLLHAAALDLERVGPRRTLNMPGVSATVGEQIEALRRAGGDKAVKLIRRASDPLVERIISGWPRDFDTARANALGFTAETSMDEILRVHIEDELGGHVPVKANA